MGLLTSLFRRSLENPSTPLSAPDDWLFDSLGSFRASSGVNVNRETALTYAPYWRCTSLLSGDVAKLPLCVYRVSDAGKEHDKTHPSYRLLRYQASPELMSLQFKRVLTLHAIAEGNGYAYIQRDGAGRPLELWPLSPMKTYPVRENQNLWYVTEVGARQRKVRAEDMFHLKGLSFDGMVGYSVVAKMRESIGLALAFDNFGSIFFRNNARPNVVLKHPGRLKPEARINLRESWERMHSGLENAHRTAILEEGLDLTVLQHNARDSQLLESKGFSRTEIALWFGVPPHKVGDDSRTSYASLEQENEAYVDDGGGLGFWLAAWEAECWAKLLTEAEKKALDHCIEFDRSRLLRANLTARTAHYVAMIQNGVMSANEVRSEEGLNPREGGDDYLQPLNMKGGQDDAGDDQGDEQKPPAKPPVKKKQRRRPPAALVAATRDVLVDALARMARRLANVARRVAKAPAAYCDGLDLMVSENRELIIKALTPAAAAARQLGGSGTAEDLAGELLDGFKAELLEAAGSSSPATLEAQVEAVCVRLENERAAELAGKVFEGRAKPNSPSRTPAQAFEVLGRLPDDPDDPGRIPLPLPLAKSVKGEDLAGPEDLKGATKKAVKLRQLIGTRPTLKRQRIEEFISDPEAEGKLGGDDKDKMKDLPADRPYVVEEGSTLYVYDGHHRLAAWYFLGAERVKVYYYKAD
jgi:HK97 family phage portal protein